MEEHDLDVLVLGRVANMRYLAGVPLLWNAGTRPFGPGCVAVRATREIYLLSTWDEAVPEEIPHDGHAAEGTGCASIRPQCSPRSSVRCRTHRSATRPTVPSSSGRGWRHSAMRAWSR